MVSGIEYNPCLTEADTYVKALKTYHPFVTLYVIKHVMTTASSKVAVRNNMYFRISSCQGRLSVHLVFNIQQCVTGYAIGLTAENHPGV